MSGLLAWPLRVAALALAASTGDVALDLVMPAHTPVIKVGQHHGPPTTCGCAAQVAGPDGSPRDLISDDCYNSTECTGECVYEHGDDDYVRSCGPIGPEACGVAACPPPLWPGDTVIAENCIRAPSCEGVCVWEDPDTGFRSYDLCDYL